MHKTIVIAVTMLGTTRVNPSALFAKLFEVTPKKTAKTKNNYDDVMFIKLLTKFFIFWNYYIRF